MTAPGLRTFALATAMVCALFTAGPQDLAAAQDKFDIGELRIRAENNDKVAMRQLANAYYLGRDGIEKNFGEAARWYLKLAKLGDPQAQTSVGLMYARGYGLKKNLEEARRWWTLAAVQDDPGAQFNLGLLYARGDGVAQDYGQAFRWYREAAERGNIQAQHNLGMLYREGKGTPPDPVRAYYWIAIAARRGDDMARKSLEAIAAGMTREQKDMAASEVDEWFRRSPKARQ